MNYHAVIVDEDAPVVVKEFPNREALLCFLREARHKLGGGSDARLQVFVFRGDRLDTTEAPYPYLLEADQPPAPLFTPPEPGRVAAFGDLFEVEDGHKTDKEYQEATQAARAETDDLLAKAQPSRPHALVEATTLPEPGTAPTGPTNARRSPDEELLEED